MLAFHNRTSSVSSAEDNRPPSRKGKGADSPDEDGEALEWINIEDDTCKWYEFENEEPIAVMRCNRCGNHPDVDEAGVVCPVCRNRSPVRSPNIIDVIKGWNDFVDPPK